MVLDERRKPEYLAKNLSWQTVENQETQSTYDGGSGNQNGPHCGKASALTTPTLLSVLVSFC